MSRMFTPEEIEIHLTRIENKRRGQDVASMEDDEPGFEDPKPVSERARQFHLIRELLTAPALGTS